MIKFLVSTDTMLLRVFQAVSDFLEISFGINCFALAKVSIVLRFLFAFAFDLTGQCFISIALLSFFVCGGKIQRSDFDGMRNASENFWELRVIVFTSMFASLIVASAYPQGYSFSETTFPFLDFACVYFMSCTPLPPGTKESKRLSDPIKGSA